MISTEHDVLPLLMREADRLKDLYPTDHMHRGINAMVERFRELHSRRVFDDRRALLIWYTKEVFEKDNLFNPPPTIFEEVKRTWRRILRALTQDDALDTQHGGGGGGGGNGTGGPTVLIVREQTDVPRADLVPYIDLALALGADKAIKVLVAAGILGPAQESAAVAVISEFLGDCAPNTTVGPVKILKLPPTILRLPDVRTTLIIMLSDDVVYKELLRRHVDHALVEDQDASMHQHEKMVKNLPRAAREILEDFCRNNGVRMVQEIREVIDEVVKEYQACSGVELTDVVPTITRRGNTYPVPSLRQRLLIVRGRERNVYAGLKPDKGKTLAAISIWRETNQRLENKGELPGRCLYIGPREPVRELSNRIQHQPDARTQHQGYFVRNAPTVGRIERGITKGELEEELSRDMIFASIHMLFQQKGNRDVVEHILQSCDLRRRNASPIRCVIVDEAHNLNGDAQFAYHIRRLLAGIPNLYEEGRIVFLSATPITNDLEGFQKTLELVQRRPALRPRPSEQGKSGRTFDIDQLRLDSMLYVPVLDPLDKWQEYITEIGFELSPAERRFQQMIVDNSSRTIAEKMSVLKLFVLNPRLVSGNPQMPWTLLRQLSTTLDQYLCESQTVLITEDALREGVTDEYENGDGEAEEDNETFPPLYRAIEQHLRRYEQELGVPIRFNVIHGDTKPADRDAFFRMAEESQANGLTKTVTFVMRQCVGEGINLSCYDRQIGLQHPWTVPFYEQLIRRSAREDNENFKAAVLIVLDSIYEAQYWHAHFKAESIQTFLHGHTLNEQHVGNISRADDDTSTYSAGGEEQIGTPIVKFASTPERNAERARAWLQNRGLQKERRIWQSSRRQVEWPKLFVRQQSGLTVPDHTLACAGLLRKLREDGVLEGNRILDVKSHALALQRALSSMEGGDNAWNIESILLYQSLGSEGVRLAKEDGVDIGHWIWQEGMMNESARLYPNGGFDAAVATDGFQNTKVPRLAIDDLSGQAKYDAFRRNERIETILSNLAVVRDNGLLIYLIPSDVCTEEEWGAILGTMVNYGIQVLPGYSGMLRSKDNDAGDRYSCHAFVGRKSALKADERREWLRVTLPDMSAQSLQMTNVQQWEERQRRTYERQHHRRRLPYPLLHHEFASGRHEFQFPYRRDERKRQLHHLATVTTAVQVLRDTGRENLTKLTKEQKDTLRALGVMYSPVLSRPGRPAFQFVDEKQDIYQILDPLDPVWDEPSP